MRKKRFLFSFRVPLLLTRPISFSLLDFQQGAFASKTFARRFLFKTLVLEVVRQRGTPLFGLYGYVPLNRVWFSGS